MVNTVFEYDLRIILCLILSAFDQSNIIPLSASAKYIFLANIMTHLGNSEIHDLRLHLPGCMSGPNKNVFPSEKKKMSEEVVQTYSIFDVKIGEHCADIH